MARLKRELVTQRETEAKAAFKGGATVSQVNEALAAKYEGKKMAMKRLYALRKEVKAENPDVVDVTVEAT